MCCALKVVGERAVASGAHIQFIYIYIPALQVVGDERIVIISLLLLTTACD